MLLTKASHEKSATTVSHKPSFFEAEDLFASKKMGSIVQKDLANIVASFMKNKLPDDKVQSKLAKYPRSENIANLQNPLLICNHIQATAVSSDVI